MAFNQRSGIRQIDIEVIEGEAVSCNRLGLPRLVPCRAGAVTQTHICPFTSPLPRSATCNFQRQLGDRRLITYRAFAASGRGTSARTPSITYGAGASPNTAILGLGEAARVIPWEVARPIWWNTSTISVNADRLDIGFLPDTDWPTYRAFTDALQPIVLGAHFNTQTRFSQMFTVMRDQAFDLWAGPPGANAQPPNIREFPGLVSNMLAATHGQLIVHQESFRDFASIGFRGSATVWGLSPRAPLIYTHETGHIVFGLGDEYCCDGGNFSISDPLNVFNSLEDCQAALVQFPGAQCMIIPANGGDFWYITDGRGPQIMRDTETVDAEWRTASGRAVARRIFNCGNLTC